MMDAKQRDAERLKREEQIAADYYLVFSSLEGQNVLADIQREGFIFRKVPQTAFPHVSNLYEGARQLALTIMAKIERGKQDARHIERQTHAVTSVPHDGQGV